MPFDAAELDRTDPLADLRDQFHLPPDSVYFDANSLGLLSRPAEAAVLQTLEQWKTLAIEGWTRATPDWFHLVEHVSRQLEYLMTAPTGSITLIGSTTVELHQLLATLYRSDDSRPGILIDASAFPTDRYAVVSFLRRIGRDPAECLVEVGTSDAGMLDEDRLILGFDQPVQLAILPSVVYTTAQLLDISRLTKAARAARVRLCWDFSHSAGIVPHDLSALQPDAAFWCTYKYLNGGPGSVAAMYLNPDHHGLEPGLTGWFGCDKARQFEMSSEFHPAMDAGRLQLGTPHVLSLAALRGSLEIIKSVGITALRTKSLKMTRLIVERVREQLSEFGVEIVTPTADERRGGHVALRHPDARRITRTLRSRGYLPDFRAPDLLRLAPSPLYSRFMECEQVVSELLNILQSRQFTDEDGANELVP